MTEVALPMRLSANTLEQWAASVVAAAEIAEALAGTAFIPASLLVFTDQSKRQLDLQRTKAQVAATLIAGNELGLDPMASLRSIDIVQGTPSLRAFALRALVQQRGHTLQVVESNDQRAIVRGRRVGESDWQQSTWTLDRAQKLGLTNREQWRKQPAAMLVARATAECARFIAADALLGIPYSSEEVSDGADNSTGVASSASPDAPVSESAPRQRRQRALAPSAAPSSPQVSTAPPVERVAAPRPLPDDPFDEDEAITAEPWPDPEPEMDEPSIVTAELPEFDAADPEPAMVTVELPDVAPASVVAEHPENLATALQMKAVNALMNRVGIDTRDRAAVHRRATEIVGYPVETLTTISVSDASRIIDELSADARYQAETPS